MWKYLNIENGDYINTPDPGIPVLAILKWGSGKEVPAIIKYGDWEDHSWRTVAVDDDSELSHSLNVLCWMYVPKRREDGSPGGADVNDLNYCHISRERFPKWLWMTLYLFFI